MCIRDRVGGALTMLVVLLVVLGGFLDGLELNQTGPYRAHEGRLLVFSQQSDLLIQRSRVDTKQADALAKADGVTKVGALNQIASTAEDPDGQIVDIVLFGYDLATDVLPAPPADGAAVIDSALANRNDVGVGDTLLLGATSEPVKVASIVDDLSQGSPTVWWSSQRCRAVVGAARRRHHVSNGVRAISGRARCGASPSSAPPSSATNNARTQEKRLATSSPMRSHVGRRWTGVRCMAPTIDSLT